MCEFVSWIGKGDKVLFLTHDLIFNTRKGKKLQEWCGSIEDYKGHGAIRYYFGMERDEGVNNECINFSTPKNFPPVIVEAIKRGGFSGIGLSSQLLTQSAWAEYEKARQQVRSEYKKATQSAWAEYEKAEQSAWAEYEKAEQPALAEYKKVEQPARAEYEKARDQKFWDLFAIPENRNPEWR